MTSEKVRLRIGSLAKAVLVTGQAYQDPKDALNEFVSNAADEYAMADSAGGRIRVVLRRRGRYPTIAVDDDGRGMSPERLREVARNLFKSVKADDDRVLGEKAIGMLAFQQLGGRLDVVSRAEGSDETWCLHLERGKATASLERERRRARDLPGTTVFLGGLDREVLRMLTQRKVVDYLRRRRGAALSAGAYEIEVVEGRQAELVTPEELEGVKVQLPARRTLWGTIEFAIHVSPPDAHRRSVAVVGRAGTTIVDDLAELEEFDHAPWNSGQLSGRVVFAALAQTAGRRAVLRDDEVYPVFLDAVQAIEPVVADAAERVAREVDEEVTDRLNDEIRRVFGRVLKELADLDNPMRTPVGGEGPGDVAGGPERTSDREPERDGPTLDDLDSSSTPTPTTTSPEPPGNGRRGPGDRSRRLPSLERDPEPGPNRSRFDPEDGTVYYNDHHPDYLMASSDERDLLDYLATLVAKEYVVYNNPRAVAEEIGEEMTRMVVRVRRHLRRRS